MSKYTPVKHISNSEALGENVGLVVIVPIFNEAQHLTTLIRNIREVVPSAQLLIIDDGSTDNSRELAQEAGAFVVGHIINRGAGAAIQTGFTAGLLLDAEVFVTIDGDGQFDPKDIPRLIDPIIKQEVDVVIGNRFLKHNTIPLLRRIYNFIAAILTFLLSGQWIGDSQSGYKAFSRKAVKSIKISANGYEFCSELIREIARNRLSYRELPVDVYYSASSLKKGQNFATGIRTAVKLLIRSLMK